MTRRMFMKLMSILGAFGIKPKRSMASMRIDKSKLVRLWYENEKGEKFIPPPNMLPDMEFLPEGFIYQRSQFPTQLTDNCLRCDDGKSTQVFRGEKGWSSDLALAMTNSGDYELWQAILIGANSCERCMNALAYHYGLKWGYPEYSEQWQRCSTSCDYCNPES